MNAIIRKETEQGVEIKKIENVGIIRHTFNVIGKVENLELWTHSMFPNTIVKLDEKTQVILEGGCKQ